MHTVEKDNTYFQCNMYTPPDLSTLPDNVRKALELRARRSKREWWQYHEGLQDPNRATLWLIGAKGVGTGFHVDWAEADNIAWASNGQV